MCTASNLSTLPSQLSPESSSWGVVQPHVTTASSTGEESDKENKDTGEAGTADSEVVASKDMPEDSLEQRMTRLQLVQATHKQVVATKKVTGVHRTHKANRKVKFAPMPRPYTRNRWVASMRRQLIKDEGIWLREEMAELFGELDEAKRLVDRSAANFARIQRQLNDLQESLREL